jgi:hypothetical protein
VAVCAADKNVFFKSITRLVTDGNCASDLLIIKRLDLRLLFQRVQVKHFDNLFGSIDE